MAQHQSGCAAPGPALHVALTGDEAFDRLAAPSHFYRRPEDVVRDGDLSLAEKRAILSAWASDACAVESMPGLRRWPGSDAPVSFDDVMDALQGLDGLRRPKNARTRRSVRHGVTR